MHVWDVWEGLGHFVIEYKQHESARFERVEGLWALNMKAHAQISALLEILNALCCMGKVLKSLLTMLLVLFGVCQGTIR